MKYEPNLTSKFVQAFAFCFVVSIIIAGCVQLFSIENIAWFCRVLLLFSVFVFIFAAVRVLFLGYRSVEIRENTVVVCWFGLAVVKVSGSTLEYTYVNNGSGLSLRSGPRIEVGVDSKYCTFIPSYYKNYTVLKNQIDGNLGE